jgi:hypothetical protein
MEVIPERPGMVTPLAPTTESMTPWAKTLVAAKAAMRMMDEYCILNVGDLKGRKIKRQLKRLE